MPESLRAIVTPLAGQTTRAIAQALNDRGIPTPRGGHWQSPQVMRLMKPSRSVNRAQRPSSRPLNGLLAFMVLRRLGFRSSAPLHYQGLISSIGAGKDRSSSMRPTRANRQDLKEDQTMAWSGWQIAVVLGVFAVSYAIWIVGSNLGTKLDAIKDDLNKRLPDIENRVIEMNDDLTSELHDIFNTNLIGIQNVLIAIKNKLDRDGDGGSEDHP